MWQILSPPSSKHKISNSDKYTNFIPSPYPTLLPHHPLPLKEAKQEIKPTLMTIKLSIPTSCAAYLGETEGMDKLHGGMRWLL